MKKRMLWLFVAVGIVLLWSLQCLISVTVAYRAAKVSHGFVWLSGIVRVTGEHEIAIDIEWRWPIKNPHPGVADEIVLLGPAEWLDPRTPGTERAVDNSPTGNQEFWGAYGGADIRPLLQTGTVKFYAAVTPNEDGQITVYLNSEADAKALPKSFMLAYMMVDSFPRSYPKDALWQDRVPVPYGERILMAARVAPRIQVSNTFLRFDENGRQGGASPLGLSPRMTELLPDKATWTLWAVTDLYYAETFTGGPLSPDARESLEAVTWASRSKYAQYPDPTILLSPDGQQALLIYETPTKLITIPLAWASDRWSVGGPKNLSKR